MSHEQRLRRDLLQSVLGMIATRGLYALGGVALARLLVPADRGRFAVLTLFVTLSGLVGTRGAEYWCVPAIAAGEPRLGVRRTVRRLVLRGTSIMIVAWVGAIVIATALSLERPTLLLATGAALANVASTVALAFATGARRLDTVAVAQVAAAACFVSVLAFGLLTDQSSTEFAVGASLISMCVMASVAYVGRRGDKRVVTRASGEDVSLGNASRVALEGMASELLLVTLTRVDVLIVAAFLSKADLGVYAVALSVTELLWVIPHGVSLALAPFVAERSGSSATSHVVSVVFYFGVFVAIGLSLAAPAAIPIVFGEEYEVAPSVIALLSFGAVALGVWRPLAADLTGRGLTVSRRRSAAIGTVFIISLSAALTPWLGLTGAAISVAVAYTAAASAAGIDWTRATGAPFRSLFSLSGAIAMLLPRVGRRSQTNT